MYKVYLDPGHGGTDPGAVKFLIERDVNLVQALACKDFLIATGKFEVRMSRTSNSTNTSITAMASSANSWGANVVVSVHNNSGGGDGFEAYHSVSAGSKGKAIAAKIEAQVKAFGQNSRGLKTRVQSSGVDYYGIIRLPNAPAIILEGGFVDNTIDILDFDSIAEQQAMGVAYAKGLCDYFGVAYSGITVAKPATTTKPVTVSKPVTVAVAKSLNAKQKQTNLKYIGYYYRGSIDGKEGPQTKQAYKDFQAAYGLAVDGVCGPKTTAKIISVACQVQKIIGVSADGIVGAKTIAGIKAYQKKKGLRVDGFAGKATLTKMGLYKSSGKSLTFAESKYFKQSEFRCGCRGRYCNGFPVGVSSKLLWILEQLRIKYGKPITITSGVRCRRYNNSLAGSSSTSTHMQGKAADIYIPGVSLSRIKADAYALGATYSYYGTKNMGNAIHINV